jgi:putative Mn2+ efflux pump MntP
VSIPTVIVIAVSLAMDAFAVSIASGIAIRQLRLRHALTIGLWFGAFQAIMPLLGWLAAGPIRCAVAVADHWIAFTLLTLLGVKMICESRKIGTVEKTANPTDIYVLFFLSIATSIDAFVMGVTFATLQVAILFPILVIGAITFVMSFLGVFIGDRSGHFFEKKIELLAGIILIAVGGKILVSHLYTG